MSNQVDKRPAKDLKSLLEAAKASIAAALPRHMTPERLIKVALVAANTTPKIMECTPQSILACVMQSASLGLEAGSPLGHAYLVPYNNKCTLIVGYRGLIDLARRSGNVRTIAAHVIYSNDHYELAYGTDEKLIHTPTLTGDRGEPVAVYAVATLADGEKQVEVMTIDEVEHIRSKSMAAQNGPWVTDTAEMARKTVVKRLCKYLPVSVEMAEAISTDNESEFGSEIVAPADPAIETIDTTAVTGGGEEEDEADGTELLGPRAKKAAAAVAASGDVESLRKMAASIKRLPAGEKPIVTALYDARMDELIDAIEPEPVDVEQLEADCNMAETQDELDEVTGRLNAALDDGHIDQDQFNKLGDAWNKRAAELEGK